MHESSNDAFSLFVGELGFHSEQLRCPSRFGRHCGSDAHPHGTRQERPHHGPRLLPLHARHRGVDSLETIDFEKQVKAVRVQFIPERTKLANGTYTRALVDSDQLEWIKLSPDTKDGAPAQDDDDEDITENPLA